MRRMYPALWSVRQQITTPTELHDARPFPGAACCKPTELRSCKAAPLQAGSAFMPPDPRTDERDLLLPTEKFVREPTLDTSAG
jgi:hypothetical protein